MDLIVDTWRGKDRRHDVVTAERVTCALGIRNVLEIQDAVSFLRSFKVSDDVAERVLLGFNRRGITNVQREDR